MIDIRLLRFALRPCLTWRSAEKFHARAINNDARQSLRDRAVLLGALRVFLEGRRRDSGDL